VRNAPVLSVRNQIAFKAVAAVEVLANILTNIVFQRKFAAWMMLNKRCHVNNHFI
jgi:hypothetical protein